MLRFVGAVNIVLTEPKLKRAKTENKEPIFLYSDIGEVIMCILFSLPLIYPAITTYYPSISFNCCWYASSKTVLFCYIFKFNFQTW